MEISKQSQSAGDNAQQIQAGTVIIQNGITEQRAREIYSEMSSMAIKENTVEAETKVIERIRKLESICLSRIEKEDAGFECFSDPAFQVLIKKAQLTAACTERDNDYSILAELLAHRIKNKTNVKKKASITRAVEILNQIDDDSLLALTVFLLMEKFVPTSGNISDGLSTIEALYEKFDLEKLPVDGAWQDNLEILGAIKTSQFGSLKKFEDYFSENLSGYVCAGIMKDSDAYAKAIDILSTCEIGPGFFEDNILLDGYVRLPVHSRDMINKLLFDDTINIKGKIQIVKAPISNERIECLEKVFDMYSTDSAICSQAKEHFVQLLYSYPAIHKAIEWWNSIPHSISLTSVGKVIAHTNAKSINPSLPDLD